MVDGVVGILGANGFVGTNLSRVLTENNIKWVGGSRRNGVDAANMSVLITWIKDNDIKYLINLAADCGGIGLNQQIPAELWASTTRISYPILEAARITEMKKTVMVGTICSSARDAKMPFKEDYIMHYGLPEETNRAYGVAKLNALIGAQAYTKQYGIKTCNLIPTNMYGPNDHFDDSKSHVIPAVIKKIHDAIKNNLPKVSLWGTGSATREFLYVDDFAYAIIAALENLETSDFVCVGTGSEVSIKDLVTSIASIMNFNGSIIWDTSKPDGQPRRCVDTSRAIDILKFTAQTSLQIGLEKTIEWYLTK